MYGYEWTDEYGIFRLTIEANIEKEIRPVFKEELDYFGMNEYWQYPDTKEPILWAEGIRRYILNGECVAEAIGGGFYTKPTIKVHKKGLVLKAVDVNKLWETNAALITGLTQRAIRFIQSTYEIYKEKGYSFTVAFSGGKDSLALLDLVSKALAPADFHVIFSDTGMELSDTYAAVEKAKQRWPQLNFHTAQCHMCPEESWDEFGPPGRRMRWCCAVHKSVPTILKMREITGDYDVKAVVFDGVRAEESARRAKYEEISVGAKNINQTNCSPILKWNTAELYCYLLHENILLNNAYRLGLFRVGCMVCPMSSDWWDGIANDHYGHEMGSLLTRVENYASKTKPPNEVKKYIEDGGWKARMGGRGLENGGNRVEERITDDGKLTLTIKKPRQKWQDVVRLLGTTVESTSSGEHSQVIGKAITHYEVRENGDTTTITYWPVAGLSRYDISHLKAVANKVAYCIGCKACMVQCPTSAFVISAEGKIHIRESICIHCINCLTFTEKGCMVAKSLSTTQGGNGMDLKGMNRYQHFGLRQQWLDHFMEYGLDCFSTGFLGTRQYDALRVWLREAGITSVQKGNKYGEITELGNKLMQLGSFSDLTWAVIWTNLCYNSIICKWYALSTEIDVNYDKNLLIEMLGDDYTKSTRDNAITALLETLRQSPVGSSLGQGLPLPSGNSYTFLRTGWERPEAVAIMYSLYVYAENTGRYTFTLSQLNQGKGNGDIKGISPADIFGIDDKAFRDILQGLSLAYTKEGYIRVAFVGDLDNITLRKNDDEGKPITSLSILNLLSENVDE